MGHLLAGPEWPIGGQRIRPFGLLGGGLMHSRIEAFGRFGSDRKNQGAFEAGGGVMYAPNQRIVVRVGYRRLVGLGGGRGEWAAVLRTPSWRTSPIVECHVVPLTSSWLEPPTNVANSPSGVRLRTRRPARCPSSAAVMPPAWKRSWPPIRTWRTDS